MKKVFRIFLNDEGYTYIETFITIIIVLLISTVIYTQAEGINSFIKSSRGDLQATYDNLKLKVTLLEEVQNIRPPWFHNENNIEETDEYLRLYYYNGDPIQYLEFSTSEGVLISSSDSILFQSTLCNGTFSFVNNILLYEDNKYNFQVRLCITP